MKSLMAFIFVLSLPGIVAAAPPASRAKANRHQSVDSAREALGSGWMYPWYDASNDGVRRVPSSTWRWWPDGSFSGFSLSWMQWVFWGIVVVVLALLAYLLVRVF